MCSLTVGDEHSNMHTFSEGGTERLNYLKWSQNFTTRCCICIFFFYEVRHLNACTCRMQTCGCHIIINTTCYGWVLPSGRIWPCSLLRGCIGGEAINTPILLVGLSVGLSVCLPAGVSAGLQQHDVSRARSTRWPLSQREECCALQTAI